MIEFKNIGSGNTPRLGTPQQVDLGINRQSAEFERQNRGRDRVQRQIESNQERLIKNIAVQGKNRQQDLENLKNLGKFSKTLADSLVLYQKGANERAAERGAMEYYENPPSPEEMQEVEDMEVELGTAEAAGRATSAKYLADGGAPDVAARLRNLTGWEAYGYAKAMLEDGGTSYSAFLAQEGDTPMMINGKQVTLNSSMDRVERDTIERALRQTYISQYNGLNPKLLNKYLYPGMKEAARLSKLNWSKNLTGRLQDQQVAESKQKVTTAVKAGNYQTILTEIDLIQASGKSAAEARKIMATRLGEMIDDRKLNADQVAALRTAALQGRGGNIVRLSQWYEFDGLEQRALDVRRQDDDKAWNDRAREKRQQSIAFENWIEETGVDLSSYSYPERLKLIQAYEQKAGLDGKERLEVITNALNREADEVELREQQLMDIKRSGNIITRAMVGNNRYLQDKFAADIKSGSAAGKAAESAKPQIKGLIAKALRGDTGEGSLNDPDVLYSTDVALVEYEKVYNAYILQGADPPEAAAKALEAVEKNLGSDGNFLSESPFSRQNVLKAYPKEEARQNIMKANRYIQETRAAEEDPFTQGIIPGTEKAYNSMIENLKKGKAIVPQQYKAIALSQPGLSGLDIALQQLKTNNPEIQWPGSTAMVDATRNLPQDWQKWLSPAYINPTTVLRTGVALQASAEGPRKISTNDAQAISDSAHRLGLDPYELGAIIQMESGFDPNIWGGDGNRYYGLIQFGGPERGEVGMDPEKIGKYTIQEQMQFVEKFLLGRGYRPGMGVTRAYLTILAGNPNASLTAEDSNNTSAGAAGQKMKRGGALYQQAQEIMGEMVRTSPYNQPENLTPGLK